MTANPGWALRPAARADLADIWRYGTSTWGVTQSERYIDALFAVFDLLAEFPELARDRPDFTPPVRIHPSSAHLVIYRLAGSEIDIIRILHARQDLTGFLQD